MAKIGRFSAFAVRQSLIYVTGRSDEPEANLNPRLIKSLARTLLDLSQGGIQVFIATHSLFLLRELEILLADRPSPIESRFFGLHPSDNGVLIKQGVSLDDMGDIAMLDEERH